MDSAFHSSITEMPGTCWQKCYDSDFDTFYYVNQDNKEATWCLPKKIKCNDETSPISTEGFISIDTPCEMNLLSSYIELPLTYSLISRCSMCDTNIDIMKHGYCRQCYEKINNMENPSFSQYKIKCQGCQGWGRNLVGDDGFCAYCRLCLKTGRPIKTYRTLNIRHSKSYLDFPKCKSCRGWGKDLVKENGKCNHCTRKEIRTLFEARLKPKCRSCGGWGLDLVGRDGLCNHCRRNLYQESLFVFKNMKYKYIQSGKEDVLPQMECVQMENSLLGKRTRNQDDLDDFEI